MINTKFSQTNNWHIVVVFIWFNIFYKTAQWIQTFSFKCYHAGLKKLELNADFEFFLYFWPYLSLGEILCEVNLHFIKSLHIQCHILLYPPRPKTYLILQYNGSLCTFWELDNNIRKKCEQNIKNRLKSKCNCRIIPILVL